VLAALYLFMCFASAGLPMLNGFVGEFLILLERSRNMQRGRPGRLWALFFPQCICCGLTNASFSAALRRIRTDFADADRASAESLFLMAAVILWMGIGSPFFTRRMETSTQNVLQLMQRPGAYDVGGRNDLDRPAMPASGANAAEPRGVASLVNSK